MITIRDLRDLNWENIVRIAWHGEALQIHQKLADQVEQGRARFLGLITQGVPCYGVTTGLGNMVGEDLGEDERRDIAANMLRARAAAIGPAWEREIVRAMMVIRLSNFLSARDGVSVALCHRIVELLNLGVTPWVPKAGHGMAADAIANAHCFQVLIGEGFVSENNQKVAANDVLQQNNLKPYIPLDKEGIALINGITAAPAYAISLHRGLMELLSLANHVASVSVEGMSAPRDSFDVELKKIAFEPGVGIVLDHFHKLFNGSKIGPFKLQAPVSIRIIPQVHGALFDSLDYLKKCTEWILQGFTGNPLLTESEPARLLSVGVFHCQHLCSQFDAVAIALAHVGQLSERRLHRLLDSQHTGLNTQLAPRPGLDAGMVVVHKASIDLVARLKLLAQPVSLHTQESSLGQEDYMAMSIPAAQRLQDMAELVEQIFAYELLAGLTALRQRDQLPGACIQEFVLPLYDSIAVLEKDRSPGPDVEVIIQTIKSGRLKLFAMPDLK
ncbi:MAG: histidine ammonia-lyase [Parasphingorhabdus sp.]|jgi:histidine ammonia-lyase